MGGWQLVPFVLSPLLTAGCAIVIQRRRDQPGALVFAGILLLETLWSMAYVAELLSPTLRGKVIWDTVQLLPWCASLPATLLFVWEYGERGPERPGPLLAAVSAMPAAALAWVFTDPLHGRARATARLVEAPPFDSLLYDFTPPEWGTIALTYGCMAYAAVALLRTASDTHRGYHAQVGMILVGLLLPTLASVVTMVLGFHVLGQRDLTPAFFGLAALPITWALFRNRFLDLVPIARHVVLSQLPDAVFVLDARDRVVDFNPRAQEILGRQAPLGSPFSALLPEASACIPKEASSSRHEIARGEQVFDARCEPLSSPRGRARGRVVILREITERKRAEEEISQARQALEQRVAERTRELQVANEGLLAEMTRRAELQDQLHHAQRLESIGRLAGGVAHDFNNLLTILLGHLELARLAVESGRDPSPHVATAEQAGHSAAALTSQLLAFSRRQAVAPKVISVNDVVDRGLRILRRVIGEDVQLALDLSADAPPVRIDPGQLEQVLINLAVNSRDAMPDGGKLTIATRTVALEPATLAARGLGPDPATWVRLVVSDTGMGMSAETMAHAFEPFFTTKDAGRGTGIGLATVHDVVTGAGGFVEVDSAPGHGTTFTIHLPATDHAPPPSDPISSDVPRGTESIVLVEDQAALRALTTEQLTGLGYRVRAFGRAEDALEALAGDASDVALLVTDVVLAGMSGPALVEALHPVRPDLEALYVSGYTAENRLPADPRHGQPRLLRKPFTLGELARAVRKALDDQARASS